MKRATWLAIVSLTIVLCLGISSMLYLSRTSDEMEEQLQLCVGYLKKEDFAGARSSMAHALDVWNRVKGVWSLVLDQATIDNLDEHMWRVVWGLEEEHHEVVTDTRMLIQAFDRVVSKEVSLGWNIL